MMARIQDDYREYGPRDIGSSCISHESMSVTEGRKLGVFKITAVLSLKWMRIDTMACPTASPFGAKRARLSPFGDLGSVDYSLPQAREDFDSRQGVP